MSTARIEELRKKFDENPRRYFAPLANEYRKAGDFDQAIFICQEYLPQQPGHMSGHIVFGQALFEAKRLPEAKSVFETALSLDPENLIALRHLADISRDMGETDAARTWYERVLQADPRNEEVVAIMEKLGGQPSPDVVEAAAAPTAEVPAKAVPAEPQSPLAKPVGDAASSAPTVVLSAAAIQEMVRARQAGKAPAEPPPPPPPVEETLTLDESPTVEINAVHETVPMDGLEPTSQAGLMDLPTIEPLGLETNAAPGQHAEEPPAPAPLDGLDTIPLDISLPDASPIAPTAEVPVVSSAPAAAPAVDDGGLLDLDDSFGLGSAPATPATMAAPSPVDTPIDGGHDSGELLDLDFPAAPVPPAPAKEETSVPTAIIDAIQSVVPVVQDAVESTVPAVMDAMESVAPAVMDFVDTTIPSVVDAVQSVVPAVIETVAETPTAIMEAIKPPVSRPTPAEEPRISQSVPFVTETMAQLYLSQGHRAEAIEIYRKLIESRPNDAELRTRLAAIEADERSVTTPMPAAGAPRSSAAVQMRRFTGSGPSIRTVLRDLFGLDGSTTYAAAPAHLPVPGEVGSIDMLFSAEPVAGELSPLALAFDGGYVASRGTVDELFGRGAR